ncbi:hypothetical protein [Chromobacterium violaceum]|uniref:hypothetical protein n=1 Tax=Chromobacterium violaceum TaxID=536 RepID=UPI00111BFAE4|nr:hypothetical protein [Chromobacterium violaceum]
MVSGTPADFLKMAFDRVNELYSSLNKVDFFKEKKSEFFERLKSDFENVLQGIAELQEHADLVGEEAVSIYTAAGNIREEQLKKLLNSETSEKKLIVATDISLGLTSIKSIVNRVNYSIKNGDGPYARGRDLYVSEKGRCCTNPSPPQLGRIAA